MWWLVWCKFEQIQTKSIEVIEQKPQTLTEFRNHGMTDMLKTVYPSKTQFCGGITKVLNYVAIRKIAGHWKANTRGPWATMLTWVNSYKGHYKSLIQHFRLSVAMVTDQNEEFVQLLYAWWRTTQQTFIKMSCQNTCIEIAIKIYFHFSHYKSMETLHCHSNESTWSVAIKKTQILSSLMLWSFCKVSASSTLRFLKKWFFNIFSQI